MTKHAFRLHSSNINSSNVKSINNIKSSNSVVTFAPKRTVKCKACHERFPNNAALSKHVDESHRFKCSVCDDFSTTVRRRLNGHMRDAHKIREKRFRCDGCDFATAYRHTLDYHRHNNHRVRMNTGEEAFEEAEAVTDGSAKELSDDANGEEIASRKRKAEEPLEEDESVDDDTGLDDFATELFADTAKDDLLNRKVEQQIPEEDDADETRIDDSVDDLNGSPEETAEEDNAAWENRNGFTRVKIEPMEKTRVDETDDDGEEEAGEDDMIVSLHDATAADRTEDYVEAHEEASNEVSNENNIVLEWKKLNEVSKNDSVPERKTSKEVSKLNDTVPERKQSNESYDLFDDDEESSPDTSILQHGQDLLMNRSIESSQLRPASCKSVVSRTIIQPATKKNGKNLRHFCERCEFSSLWQQNLMLHIRNAH